MHSNAIRKENYTQYLVEYFFFEGLSPLGCHFKNYNMWIDADAPWYLPTLSSASMNSSVTTGRGRRNMS